MHVMVTSPFLEDFTHIAIASHFDEVFLRHFHDDNSITRISFNSVEEVEAHG